MSEELLKGKELSYAIISLRVVKTLKELKKGKELTEERKKVLDKGKEYLLNIALNHARILHGSSDMVHGAYPDGSSLYKFAIEAAENSWPFMIGNEIEVFQKYRAILQSPVDLEEGDKKYFDCVVNFFGYLDKNIHIEIRGAPIR